MYEYTNSLVNSTSPYLLQHAHNPVDWQEWGEEALNRANEEDKPILVSIGYSSCHWCHVMEKESFEDSEVAKIMNTFFINIKVDREERPDIDQIYMDAVQTMGLRGGWPLNVFLTPDQKPFYGGTYFPKQGWINLLTHVYETFEKNRLKIDESAEAFTENLQLDQRIKYRLEGTEYKLTKDQIRRIFNTFSQNFDIKDGGIQGSPKFPMPSIWQYFATHYYLTQDSNALNRFHFTLGKIADGGIYDHIGGGFARYSTDSEWHVPHFEKMLYDNGQLLSLFANGFKLSRNQKYKNTILETIAWLKREMLDENGGFYAALDADSEGEEGKFYVWTYEEMKEVCGNDFNWLSAYYNILPEGNWEGKNILRVVKTKQQISDEFELSIDEIELRLSSFKQRALKKREERTRPRLDYKIIAGWNGLTLTGLLEAYQALQDSSILPLAKTNAAFIKEKLIKNGKLNRFPDKDMEGFMEDYAAVIQSFIKYYETSLDSEYLDLAMELTERVGKVFYDEKEKLYCFISEESQPLIARKKELFDNVISSSNSLMAWNLIHLGTHLYHDDLVNKGKIIIAHVLKLMLQEPQYMSNWAITALEISQPMAEIIIVGPSVDEFINTINQQFIPNKIISGSRVGTDQIPFENKVMINGQTTIYVCHDKSCKLPVKTVEEALEQL